MDFNFNPEELQRQQDEANTQKRNLALMGGIGDALASQQSFGNIFLGRPNQQSTAASRTAGAMADSIQDPTERQAKLYENYKRAQEGKKLKDEEARVLKLRDPKSSESIQAKAFYSKKGMQVDPNDTAEALEARYGKSSDYSLAEFKEEQSRRTEIAKARSKNAGAPKGMKYQVNQTTGEMELVPIAKTLPAETAAKLGNLLGAVEASGSIESMAGKHSTGKIDAGIDWLREAVGLQDPSRARFSADVATQRNQVMNRMAGANVTADEKERVLEGIPTRRDAPEQFKAKAQSTTDGILRSAQTEIDALEAAGYDTSRLRQQLDAAKRRVADGRSVSTQARGQTGAWGIDTAEAAPAVDYSTMSDEELTRLWLEKQNNGGK